MANMTPRAKRNRRARLKEMYGSVCQLCGKKLHDDEITLDHIVPKSENGSNGFHNLRIACRTCNHDRHHVRLP